MKRILIIGGSYGISNEILKQHIDTCEIISISRSGLDINHNNLIHHEIDVLNDELPLYDCIDSLVYCPGTINLKPILSLKEDDLLNDYKVNVLGAIKCVKHYLKALKSGQNPSIVLFSSVAANLGMPFHSSVSASKAAVEGLVKALAAELSPGIRVNAIAPNITDTPLAAPLLRNPKVVDKIIEKIPLKKILSPKEIASCVAYLISDHAAAITGQIIAVDGGMSTLRI